jgi:hypothetical protein
VAVYILLAAAVVKASTFKTLFSDSVRARIHRFWAVDQADIQLFVGEEKAISK